MNCKELAYLLGDYLDGTMEEQLRGELDVHIEMCDSCMNFLNTYDKTRIICRQIRLSEIPEEFKSRLHRARLYLREELSRYLREGKVA